MFVPACALLLLQPPLTHENKGPSLVWIIIVSLASDPVSKCLLVLHWVNEGLRALWGRPVFTCCERCYGWYVCCNNPREFLWWFLDSWHQLFHFIWKAGVRTQSLFLNGVSFTYGISLAKKSVLPLNSSLTCISVFMTQGISQAMLLSPAPFLSVVIFLIITHT